MAKLNFKFLKDEPLNKDGDNFFNFYHAIIAPALLQILENETTPHTIGLFGSWGTGKSTIIRMLQDDPRLNTPIFIFDAWKYKDDALRRTFLIKLVEFAETSGGAKLDKSILKPLYATTSNSITQQSEARDQPTRWKRFLAWIKSKSLPLILMTSFVLWIVFNIVHKNSDISATLRQMSGTILGISFVAVLLKPAVEETIKHAVKTFFGSLERETEVRTQTEYEERLNSPEQFEEKFKEIMKALNKKVVIVFDNIDRVPGDIAISMLSTIKTFMEPSKDGTAVFIVPCDAEAIERQIVEYYGPAQDEGMSKNFEPSDYLRKIFNLVMWVPEFVGADLEQYTKQRLGASGDVKELIDNEDVILVINAAFSKNPREIVQFINNLIALVVAAQESDVKEIINNDVAYLAKVLVLKQKFPDAYRRLKENWYKPEEIIGDPSNSVALTNFMNLTSRITVEDAEPFIYFKNPDGSRGLKNSRDLKAALVGGNLEEAIKAAIDETDKDAVADFVIDLAIKHKGQEEALQNIFTTQFKLFAGIGADIKQKRYFENLGRTLDGQLWQKYRELPVDDIFKLLSSKVLPVKIRNAIVERYVVALGRKDNTGRYQDFDISILESFRLQPKLLDSEQSVKIRAAIEQKYNDNEVVLAMFQSIEDQESFITKTTVENYIATLDAMNIVRRMPILQQYKTFIIRQKLLESVVSVVAELLHTENTTNPAYSENKAQIVNTLASIYDTFGNNALKALEAPMTALSEALVGAFDGDGGWENRLLITRELWRFIFATPQNGAQGQAMARIRTFFTNVPPDGMQQALEYWESYSKTGNLVHNFIDTLLPRIISDSQILASVYRFADNKEKVQILNHLIESTPLDNPYDLTFIKQVGDIPDRIEVIKKLLERVGKFTYNQKAPYYDYLADRLRRNDPRDVKDVALEQARSLIQNDDPSFATVGYNFLAGAKFLSDSDKRETAKEVLGWLREPGRTIDYRHRLAIKMVTSVFTDLQKTPQADLVYLLFNLLDQTHSQQTIEVALEGLKDIEPSYSAYEKDYSDLLSRLQNWQDQNTKSYVLAEMQPFKSLKSSSKEKKFWNEFKALEKLED